MNRLLAPRLSLRLRLLAILVAAIVFTTLVLAGLVFVTARSLLVNRIDAQLAASGPLAQNSYETLLNIRQPQFAFPSDYLVIVRASQGQAVLSSDGTATLADSQIAELGATSERPWGTPYTISSRDGGFDWRTVSYPLEPRGSVSVALPMDAGVTAGRLAVRILLIGLSIAAITALVGSWAVTRSMRPLRDVEATAAAIAAGDFSRRMPEGRQDTEIGRLTAALNGMLTQIETAIRSREVSRDRMRQFVADASHELRTPLAAIRGYAELHRQGAVPDDEVPATFARVEDEARRLGMLVEDLLTLARLDELRPIARDQVDLGVVAMDTASSVHALDPSRPVRVVGPDGTPFRPVTVTADADRIRQVLANLAGNAVRHTPAGTPVEIVLWPPAGGWVRVDLVDHGQGIRDEDKERIFERFARLDASRTRGTGGAGLGLSIVASVVAAHRGRVGVFDTPGGGATFRVELLEGGPDALPHPDPAWEVPVVVPPAAVAPPAAVPAASTLQTSS